MSSRDASLAKDLTEVVDKITRPAPSSHTRSPPDRRALDRRALGLALTRIANVSAGSNQTTFADTDVGPASDTDSALDRGLDSSAGSGVNGATQSLARRIGITGAPGSGKSTLCGRLALERLRQGGGDLRIGVLAIDPSSPRTGGAILGDRIRMDDLEGSENLYIRSFGSRSSADGLTDNLHELLETMDRHGFDEVLVETVGVGQAELASRSQVDTLVLVIPPDAGDVVQAMKAGIMEIADIFAINKADMPSAAKMATEVKRVIALTHRAVDRDRDRGGDWMPPVVLTSYAKPESIAALSEQIDRHQQWLASSGRLGSQFLERRRYRLRRWLERRAQRIIDDAPAAFFELPQREQLSQLLQQLSDQQES